MINVIGHFDTITEHAGKHNYVIARLCIHVIIVSLLHILVSEIEIKPVQS